MRLKTFGYFLFGIILILLGVGGVLYFSFNIVLQVSVASVDGAIFGAYLFYLLTSVPAFQGSGALIARGLSFWKSGEKKAVALEIERSLNAAKEELNEEVEGLIPYSAKVEWVDRPSYLNTEEEVVVIRMREHDENPRNVACAVVDYITKGMIPYSRLYIEKPIQTAMDSTMVRTILINRDQAALDYFLTNVLNKRLDKRGVKKYLGIFDNLSKRGMFTRIFLEEMKELGSKLYPMLDPRARKETKEFLNNLNILATRETGEQVQTSYIGKKIKVAYLLIADPERIQREGQMPYINYAMHCKEDGADTIYILSRGWKNKPAVNLANKIALVCKMRIVKVSQFEELRDDHLVKALCIEMRV